MSKETTAEEIKNRYDEIKHEVYPIIDYISNPHELRSFSHLPNCAANAIRDYVSGLLNELAYLGETYTVLMEEIEKDDV